MCDKAVDDYAHALEFVPDRFKTQTCAINVFPIILSFHDRYKTPEICNKVHDGFLPRLKFAPD